MSDLLGLDPENFKFNGTLFQNSIIMDPISSTRQNIACLNLQQTMMQPTMKPNFVIQAAVKWKPNCLHLQSTNIQFHLTNTTHPMQNTRFESGLKIIKDSDQNQNARLVLPLLKKNTHYWSNQFSTSFWNRLSLHKYIYSKAKSIKQIKTIQLNKLGLYRLK